LITASTFFSTFVLSIAIIAEIVIADGASNVGASFGFDEVLPAAVSGAYFDPFFFC
jgi:hypothetical protein